MNKLIGCEEAGKCTTREREGDCEGCVTIRALNYGESSFDNSDDGNEEIESDEDDQNQDVIPEEDKHDVEGEE